MKVECAVCDMEFDADAAVFRVAGDEYRDLFFCSDRCLLEFERNPEVYAFEGFDEDERWGQGGGAAVPA